MKKILVVEDQKQYQENWKNFFANFGQLLDAEAEVIEEIESSEELLKKILKKVAEGYYLLIDNDLRGFNEKEDLKNRGEAVCCGLEMMGFSGKIAMISASNFNGKVNLGKGSLSEESVRKVGAFLIGYDTRIDYDDIPECTIQAYRDFARKVNAFFKGCS